MDSIDHLIGQALKAVVEAEAIQAPAGKTERYWALLTAHSALLQARNSTSKQTYAYHPRSNLS